MLQGSPDMKDELDLSGVGGRFEQRKPQGEQFTPTRNQYVVISHLSYLYLRVPLGP